jgi:hypothetical protein
MSLKQAALCLALLFYHGGATTSVVRRVVHPDGRLTSVVRRVVHPDGHVAPGSSIRTVRRNSVDADDGLIALQSVQDRGEATIAIVGNSSLERKAKKRGIFGEPDDPMASEFSPLKGLKGLNKALGDEYMNSKKGPGMLQRLSSIRRRFEGLRTPLKMLLAAAAVSALIGAACAFACLGWIVTRYRAAQRGSGITDSSGGGRRLILCDKLWHKKPEENDPFLANVARTNSKSGSEKSWDQETYLVQKENGQVQLLSLPCEAGSRYSFANSKIAISQITAVQRLQQITVPVPGNDDATLPDLRHLEKQDAQSKLLPRMDLDEKALEDLQLLLASIPLKSVKIPESSETKSIGPRKTPANLVSIGNNEDFVITSINAPEKENSALSANYKVEFKPGYLLKLVCSMKSRIRASTCGSFERTQADLTCSRMVLDTIQEGDLIPDDLILYRINDTLMGKRSTPESQSVSDEDDANSEVFDCFKSDTDSEGNDNDSAPQVSQSRNIPQQSLERYTVLKHSRLLSKTENEYLFEFDPSWRLARNSWKLDDVYEKVPLSVYSFKDAAVAPGRTLNEKGTKKAPGLNLQAKYGISVLGIIQPKVKMHKHDVNKYQITWSPPACFCVQPGDMLVLAARDSALPAGLEELFDGHMEITVDLRKKVLYPFRIGGVDSQGKSVNIVTASTSEQDRETWIDGISESISAHTGLKAFGWSWLGFEQK